MRTSKGKTPRARKAVPARKAPDSPTIVPVTGALQVRSLGESAARALVYHHENRQASIAEAAYFRSERRGFAPGYELEDWLAAEEEVDQRLFGERAS